MPAPMQPASGGAKMQARHGEVFQRIYGQSLWGGGSGIGSREATTTAYREVLGRILASGRVKRVVDLGCGDWEFSRLIDWSGIGYVGVDVVPSVIKANQRQYGTSRQTAVGGGQARIRFECADIRTWEGVHADLYILKDVLQHWPDDEIKTFLSRMAGREMLITNSVGAGHTDLKMPGHFRPVDVRQPPFGIKADELLCYEAMPGDIKLVLLVPGMPVRQAQGGQEERHAQIVAAARGSGGTPQYGGPQDAAALHRFGVFRGRAGDGPEAVRLLAAAVRLQQADANLHNDLGVALEQCGRYGDAARCYRRAVALRPTFHQVWTNLANALSHSCDPAGALQAARESLRLCRTYAPAHNALGSILLEQGDRRGACEAFQEATRLNSGFVEAHANLGMAMLALGDFENGWRELGWRTQSGSAFWNRPGKSWDGSDPFGMSILLYAEGGLGDGIQFGRYATVLAEMGAIVTIECRAKLVPLLRTIPGVRQVVAQGDPLPHYDLHCPLRSVPAIVGTRLDTIPAKVPYIHPEPGRVERWGAVVEEMTGRQGDKGTRGQGEKGREKNAGTIKVGVCWQGEQQLPWMRDRSFDPMLLSPLSQVPSVSLINLQFGVEPPAGLPLVTLPGMRPDHMPLEDTTAVMKHLDLVITCDTSVAHLAGALGVPVWVALKQPAEWRWMEGRDDSPWYPTMRLFRQQKPGEWEWVFRRMAEFLLKPRHGDAGTRRRADEEVGA